MGKRVYYFQQTLNIRSANKNRAILGASRYAYIIKPGIMRGIIQVCPVLVCIYPVYHTRHIPAR